MSDGDERIKAAAELVYNQGFHDSGKRALDQVVRFMAQTNKPVQEVIAALKRAYAEYATEQGVNVDG